MAELKEKPKVKDFTDTVKEITGLVKENYLNGVEFALSLWTENQKIWDAQIDQWLNLQQEYINAGKEFYEKLPKDITAFSNVNSVDRFITLQKEYVESVRRVSDKLTRETLGLAQKNVEKTFSLIDGYLDLFRV
jgi:hypothetical protein